MLEDTNTDQENLNTLMHNMLTTPKPTEEPPKPTRADYNRKFRIVFDEEKPVFEEVEE